VLRVAEPRIAGTNAEGAPPGSVDGEIAEAARALLLGGRKIEAVKLVKERTGFGLKEAKDYVESL